MNLQSTARILLGVFCIMQGLATVVLDLNRTHAAHPQWLGHARFHVVWQTVTAAVLAIIEACLLGYPGLLVSERFYLTAILACAPMAGFFGALVSRRVYGGTLSDPGGIPPARFSICGRVVQVDMNLVAEIAGVITVAGIVGLYRVGGPHE
ncbi:MAG: hypothetical protein JF563_07185 [Acidobacteriales bacterium]|nr:hypothetical protein [Terriglobales bacterium]